MIMLDEILREYGELLSSVDRWFSRSMRAAGEAVSCAKGCCGCCRGLFDITLMDACFLKRGFDRLPPGVRMAVRDRSLKRLDGLKSVRPGLEQPYVLNIWPEDEWEPLMPDDDETPCPLLGEDGLCLVYDHRPMTCRLHGIPLVDVSGDIFHDEWCTLNFLGDDPLSMKVLYWEFRDAFEKEILLFHRFTSILLKEKINELDTLIPAAVLIDFDDFDWEGWWRMNAERIRAAGSAARE